VSLTFTHPWALLLVALILPAAWIARGATRPLPIPRSDGLAATRLTAARVIASSPGVLRALTLGALTLAIAGPVTAGAVIEERSEGVPIVLAVDISSSMLAQDFQPRDRLEVAKATMARFVEGRPDDPIALVAFAAEALTLVPATTHRGVLLSALETLRVGLLEDGTAVGDGLATSVNRLRLPEADGVVVLLTDGESNRGTVDARDAAEAAAALGVRVYTVGVGSDGVAPVPVDAAPAGFRYAELPVGIDEELLEEIAERTGGRYFRATDPQALARIYEEIDRLVPSIVETTRYRETTDWSGALLLVAAAVLAAEWLVRGSRWGALP
jgi:Ca-activated chloride channel family protein